MKTHQKTKKCSSEFARIQVANATVLIQPEIQEEVVTVQPEVSEVDLPNIPPTIQGSHVREEQNVQEEEVAELQDDEELVDDNTIFTVLINIFINFCYI